MQKAKELASMVKLPDWNLTTWPPNSLTTVSVELLNIIPSSVHCRNPKFRVDVAWQLRCYQENDIKKLDSDHLGLLYPNSLLTEEQKLSQITRNICVISRQ